MSNPGQPVRLAGTALGRSRHVCAFFNSKDEEYRVLLPFMKEGLEHGEKAFHIVKDSHRPEHRRRLQQAGIAVQIEEVLRSGKAAGYPLTRLVANMEWALEDRPGVDDIVEYETRLNYVLPKYDDAVC